MPRQAIGPRLYLDKRRRQWIIRDGARFKRTRCLEADRAAAEKVLEQYIAAKHAPARSQSPSIAEMLVAYARDHAEHLPSRDKILHTIKNLDTWWGDKRVDDITVSNCRAFIAARPQAAARRDLETLRAAVKFWNKNYGPLEREPEITLPDRVEGRTRWLTRNEVAKLLWASRRTQHLYRFILLGIYTGSRSGVLLSLKWSQIDLEGGVMRRRAQGEGERKNKRRPPVRLGRKVLAHLRRWKSKDGGAEYVCHYNGSRVTKLRRSFSSARAAAGLDKSVKPHSLRHTRATWLMKAGINPFEAAGALGMSMRVLEQTYGHHHVDFQKNAAEV